MPDHKAWPFREACEIMDRRRLPADRTVLFQTGFGPSGFPHMGHFSEVARTTWVRRAHEHQFKQPTRLISFSDDMDGLRKVPNNLPQSDMLAANLGRPLHAIPDPFSCCNSFSDHMNMKLREFLDAYNFDYEFQSSREAYERGDFDEGLSILLARAEDVRQLILPTLREENREHWSPFFPICPDCGSIMATRVNAYHPDRDSIEFSCSAVTSSFRGCGAKGEQTVLGGKAKVGWKVDWALRWYAYEVDYEMYGKDLIDSVRQSSRILRLMGKQPPVGLCFEYFLDEEGRGLSSSAGRMGVTVDMWKKYAPIESLLFFLFQNPKRAKRLHWGIVPKCVDDYLAALRVYPELAEEGRPEKELWHIHDRGANVPHYSAAVDSSVVNNLISALGLDSPHVLKEYLTRYDSTVVDNEPVVDRLIEKGMNYYKDHILPSKQFRPASPEERDLLVQIKNALSTCQDEKEETLQAIPFEVARAAGKEPKELFRVFYEVVLGQERGPRFGSFVHLVGKEQVLEMLSDKI
tara:strand:- start:3230 stop:4789 length:1560 start_codon:yes stop_codon:yes gene_type:complete